MKYTDLTEEQRKHFDMLVENYGVPEDARYFDLYDRTKSSYMKECAGSLYYLSGSDEWIFYSGDYTSDISKQYVPIPEKPWYDPTDVAFKNSEETSQMIGKWYTVIDPNSDYVNLTGECVDYDESSQLLTLKFSCKGKWNLTIDQLIEECTEDDSEDMVKRPNHYRLLPEYEVKDVNKALLDKIQESDFDMSLYEAGWYQQAMQYFLRFYGKGGLQDLEKGVETMQFVIDSLKERKGE